ncbi:MAG TPA: L,D-transpeptidase [Bacteroidales bacterium]|nr:L,D-transpeptidase [Bacteroidales bacterium]
MNIKPGKNRLVIWIVLLTILLLAVGTGLMSLFNPRPPVNQITTARKALTDARELKANQHFPIIYHEAEMLYDSMMLEWKNQNDRFFLCCDFSKVSSYSELLIEKAKLAKDFSKANISSIKTLLPGELDSLQYSINKFDTIVRSLPLSKDLTKKYIKGKLIFLESKSAYENGDFKSSYDKFVIAYQLCTDVFKDIRQFLNVYFTNYDYWVNLADETVNWTRKKKSCAVVVDKFAKSCMLYQNGRLKYTFEIELGPNWIGEKRYKGDNATPEGKYFIVQKLAKKKTKYHKALLLNYPNEEDKMRFNEEIKNGTLPESSDIGGMIEIHGEGGKGFHWTNGCIALKNEDMDRLFIVVSTGTPVVVVGSLRKLSEIFDLHYHGF